MNKPIIGITMGDPAGIGPELIVKTLNERDVWDLCIPIVIGSAAPLEAAMRITGIRIPIEPIVSAKSGKTNYSGISKLAERAVLEGKIPFIDLELDHNYRDSKLLRQNGSISLDYIRTAVELLNKKQVQGLATAPTNKEAMHKAGLECAGVTEFLANLAQVSEYSTVQIQGNVYIFQMTTHVPLHKALDSISKDSIIEFVQRVNAILLGLGIKIPRIGISGLNPHAGDGGVLGDEEQTIFRPAITKLRDQKINISDPQPTDTLFIQGQRKQYDALIYLFHDTANTAIKTAAREFPPVVVTAGLPYVRTTVAHGTAYDIAYQGIADWKQFHAAVIAAAKLLR